MIFYTDEVNRNNYGLKIENITKYFNQKSFNIYISYLILRYIYWNEKKNLMNFFPQF